MIKYNQNLNGYLRFWNTEHMSAESAPERMDLYENCIKSLIMAILAAVFLFAFQSAADRPALLQVALEYDEQPPGRD